MESTNNFGITKYSVKSSEVKEINMKEVSSFFIDYFEKTKHLDVESIATFLGMTIKKDSKETTKSD